MKQSARTKRVFVAMSGGVDSSVAAALLKESGYDVTGITMCFSMADVRTRRPSCCGAEGIEDAKKAARQLGIPHYVLDFGQHIKDWVINDFVVEYSSGRTPNPCVRCNQHIKFGILYEKILAFKGDFLATGHYARVVCDGSGRNYQIMKAKDLKKDQTYFLCGIKRDILPHIFFPLGELIKEEVRGLAERFGLPMARKPESQDICFVPGAGYQEFLKNRLGAGAFVPGPFIDPEGKVVGQHKGIINYTIGQRDGLGLSMGEPVYVLRIDVSENSIRIGPREFLQCKGLEASEFNLVGATKLEEKIEVNARIRYNAPEARGVLFVKGRKRVRFVFDEPQFAVTPGQSVVFYQGDVLLGGALIDRAWDGAASG